MWCKQLETGLGSEMMQDGHYYNLCRFGLPLQYQNNMFQATRFIPSAHESIRRCIKRDPISRFISCYTDKIILERIADLSVDQCIDWLETGQMLEIANTSGNLQLVAAHFLPQYEYLGESTTYYDYIFDVNEMNLVKKFCETFVFKIPLYSFHARNLAKAKVAKIVLDPQQMTRLRSCYAMDYKIGWA